MLLQDKYLTNDAQERVAEGRQSYRTKDFKKWVVDAVAEKIEEKTGVKGEKTNKNFIDYNRGSSIVEISMQERYPDISPYSVIDGDDAQIPVNDLVSWLEEYRQQNSSTDEKESRKPTQGFETSVKPRSVAILILVVLGGAAAWLK